MTGSDGYTPEKSMFSYITAPRIGDLDVPPDHKIDLVQTLILIS